MKTLNPAPKFLIYAVLMAIRHPKAPISYYYCTKCKIRFPASASECPKCDDKVESSPDPKQESPIPWWASLLCIIIGITCWSTMPLHQQVGLTEVARALIYIPLGSLFGLSLHR